MNLKLEKIEEFNLGRDQRFKGDIDQSVLLLIHELAADQLNTTQQRLIEIGPFKTIFKIHIDDLQKQLAEFETKSNLATFITHLSLDNEINTHRKSSNQILEQGIFQLNPYNKIAKIFDDKYLFYALMTANAINQPFTQLIDVKNFKEATLSFKDFDRFEQLIIKPRYGTESRDCIKVSSIESTEAIQQINKIHSYDDCVLQEALKYSREFKVLFFYGKFFAPAGLTISKGLRGQLDDFIDLLDDYAKSNHIIMPEIFSIDILETMDRGYIFLEANIRPAAIYQF